MEIKRTFPNLKREGLALQFSVVCLTREPCSRVTKGGNSSRPAIFQPKCIIVTSVLCSDLGDSQPGEYTPMK